jgi:hypothetical protein
MALNIKKYGQPDNIIVTPLVLSPSGVVSNVPNQSPTTLNVPPCLLCQVALNTCSKARKFLTDVVHRPIALIMSVDPIYNSTRTPKTPDSASQQTSGQVTSTQVSETTAIA